MDDDARLLLATLGRLNHAIGLATRDLLHNMGADGRLPADQLGHLGLICQDMATLLLNAAHEPVVIESTTEGSPRDRAGQENEGETSWPQ